MLAVTARSEARAASNAAYGESKACWGAGISPSFTLASRSSTNSQKRSAWVLSSSACSRIQCAMPGSDSDSSHADVERY